MCFFRSSNLLLQPFVCGCVLEISLHVISPLNEPVPKLFVHRLACKLLDVLAELSTEGFRRDRIIGESNHCELPREHFVLGEIAQSRNQLPLGQVAACSENHHDTRTCLLPLLVESLARIHRDVTLLIFKSNRSLGGRCFFKMPAKLKAHRRQELRGKIVFSARDKALEERCRKH